MNELHPFNLSTLTDPELRAVAGELGFSLELMRELRFVELVAGPRMQAAPQPQRPSADAIEELIERQRGGIRL